MAQKYMNLFSCKAIIPKYYFYLLLLLICTTLSLIRKYRIKSIAGNVIEWRRNTLFIRALKLKNTSKYKIKYTLT